MGINPQEWFKQADYDMETADFMFNGGRFFMQFLCVISPLKKQ